MDDDQEYTDARAAEFWANIDADDDPAYQVIPDEEIYG